MNITIQQYFAAQEKTTEVVRKLYQAGHQLDTLTVAAINRLAYKYPYLPAVKIYDVLIESIKDVEEAAIHIIHCTEMNKLLKKD